MSRVGKMAVAIPQGVKASLANGTVSVEGPKGKLECKIVNGVVVKIEDAKILVSSTGSSKQARSDFGTARALLNNMVLGVSKGWSKKLELSGVGFNAKNQGQTLVLSVGFSHDVTIILPKEVKIVVTKNSVELESANRQLVGDYAAKIRQVQPPEPYLGKGIRYSDEKVRRKAGKTGKK